MTRVYETTNPNFADYTVRVVDLPAMADLVVYRDDDAGSSAHSEQIWSFVKSRENAQITICFTPKGMAGGNLTIAFTDEKALAGWQRHHRMRGSLDKPRQHRRRPVANAGRRQVYWGG